MNTRPIVRADTSKLIDKSVAAKVYFDTHGLTASGYAIECDHMAAAKHRLTLLGIPAFLCDDCYRAAKTWAS